MTDRIITPTIRDALRAAGTSALWAFLGVFGVTLLGWLQAVTDWATSSGTAPFPSLSVLGYGLVSAAAGAATFVIAAVIRLAQVAGWLPGTPPTYR